MSNYVNSYHHLVVGENAQTDESDAMVNSCINCAEYYKNMQ